MRKLCSAACALGLVLCAFPALAGEKLEVGPGKKFLRPSAAIKAARDGDVIEIDTAENYDGDVCRITTNNLTVRGIGRGRARLRAAGHNVAGKGIWVTAGDNIVVENIEFSGARVPDNNGAGIRAEGTNLTVRNCKFHDCQDAILGGKGVVLVEYCEFSYCGLSRHPVTHNLYMSQRVEKLIYRYNYSHHSKIGHLLKSRARENWITYNRLSDEAEGTGSYVINLPNGGKSYIIGNLLHKGPRGQNNAVIAYGEEGVKYPQSELSVIANTMVNEQEKGTFIRVRKVASDFRLVVKNNIFAGKSQLCNWPQAIMAGNFSGGDPGLVNQSAYDFRLGKGSSCIDKGVAPGRAGGISLKPIFQYVHPASKEKRPDDGRPDIGAYKFSGLSEE